MSDTDAPADGEQSMPEPVAPGEVTAVAERLVADADDWLADNAERFDPFAPDHREVRQKAFCEAGMYLDAADGHGDEGPEPLATLLERRATDPRYYRRLLREPRGFPQIAYPLAALRRRGALSPDAGAVVERVAEWPAARQLGRPTSRQLDYWHVCRVYGCEPVGVDATALFDRGFAGGRFNAVEADQGVAFGLTHELLFYHNLGSDRAAFPSEPLAYDAPDTLRALLLRFLAEGHVDLVAELLFSGVLQRQLSPGLVRTVLGWLDAHVGDNGALGFPTDDPAELRGLVGPDVTDWDGAARRWRCAYHPTIVLGMLARTLRDDWPAIRTAAPRREVTHDGATAANLQALGGVLASLATYSLDGAAETLTALADTPAALAYDDVVDHATAYLQRQHHDDTVGSWLAERRHYLAKEGTSPESFQRDLLEPLAETVETALSAVEIARTESDGGEGGGDVDGEGGGDVDGGGGSGGGDGGEGGGGSGGGDGGEGGGDVDGEGGGDVDGGGGSGGEGGEGGGDVDGGGGSGGERT